MATYADMEELIRLGAYRAGSSLGGRRGDPPARAAGGLPAAAEGRRRQDWPDGYQPVGIKSSVIWKRNANFVRSSSDSHRVANSAGRGRLRAGGRPVVSRVADKGLLGSMSR